MKISVVISVYNEEKLLSECLDSLAKQLRQPDEIVIVDNNCTDGSMAIAARYKTRIVKESKQGIWAARATGYNAAIGDIIVCTDADARFPEKWLQQIEDSFRLGPDIIAVTGPGVFYDGSRIANALAGIWYMKAYFFFVSLALGTKPLFGSNFAVKKELWQQVRDEVHSNTETVFDDMDLSYHLLGKGKIHYSKAVRVYISIRPLKNPIGMLKRYKKGMRSVFIHWPEQAPWRIKA